MGRDEAASPWEREHGAPPAPISAATAALIEARGWRTRLEEARVHELWEQIAGEQVARHALPVRLHGGVLVVRAESPSWASQLQYLAGELLRKAQEVLGDTTVVKVTVISGRGEATGPR